MPIDPYRAAEIAKAAGLSLADARSLAHMAKDEADAVKLAKLFTDPEDERAKGDRIASKILGGEPQ